MYLQGIEIQGFKSFPKRHYIEFHPGVTGIVGPNGCGKSNVTDAVRWVLGEQSAKSMRGDKMEDVIFNGTDTRRRMSFAEVSIYLNNEDRRLEADYDLIVITRRYYRSGESEYLINQNSCRLKDITELLADTGIGKDGYSVIEQGRVDDILSDRSEDRRKIFDEAAGIVKYKMRKRDSERKLERTDEDLQRLEDISQEMERQLRPLARQAKEAEKYKEIYAEARDLDIYLSIKEIDGEEAQRTERENFLKNLDQDLLDITQERESTRATRLTLLENRRSYEETAEELSRKFREHDRALASLKEEEVLGLERIRFAKKRAEEIKSDLDAIEFSGENLDDKLSRRENHRTELESRQKKLQQELSDLEQAYTEQQLFLDQKERESKEKAEKLNAIREGLYNQRSSLFALDSEADQLDDRQIELESDKSKETTYLKAQEAILSDRQNAHKAFLLSHQEKKRLAQEAAKDLADLESSFSTSNQILAKARADLQQKEYQLETLKRLEENREGYHQAVRAISQEIDSNPSFGRGLVGPVAEIVNVDSEYEIAVEMALGASLHNLVTEDVETASKLITWLKTNRAGRETFLPLDRIEERRLNERELNQIEHLTGFLGTLDEFISTRPGLEILASHLGGRIVLAKNLDLALNISQASQKRLRIVTLAGDIINPGGSMTGGQTSRGLSGLLSRSSEIELLSKQIADLEKLIYKSSEQNQKSKIYIEKQLQDSKEAQEAYQASLVEQARYEEEIKKEEALLAEHQPRIDKIDEDLLKLADRRERIIKEKSKIQDSIEKSSLEEKNLVQDLSQDSDPKDLSDHEELRESIVEIRIQKASIDEAIKGIDEFKQQLLDEQASREEELKNLREEADKLASEQASLEERAGQILEEKKSLEEGLELISKEQEKIKEAKESSASEETALFDRLELINNQITSLEKERERYISQTERIDERLNNEKNRIWEEYRLSYIQAKELARSLNPPDKTKRRLKVLREELRSMPAVNHSAPEDYLDLSQRYELMQSQKDDILDTRSELISIIGQLEEAMRAQFISELEAINADFQETFSDLFSGGHAELSLAEGDVLDSDIEIKAQPPGKRLQNLRLLSGGERALTAIALIFAIFKQSPAPFCFLDEVDSALDDSNVIRFSEFVKDYTDTTQFIIVTHRKGTMEAADRLYGVTMKERGVSDILSMELEESQAFAQD